MLVNNIFPWFLVICLFIKLSVVYYIQIQEGWQVTPRHYSLLDVRALLQDAAIEDVEMEDAPEEEPEPEKEPAAEEEDDDDAMDMVKYLVFK